MSIEGLENLKKAIVEYGSEGSASLARKSEAAGYDPTAPEAVELCPSAMPSKYNNQIKY